MWGNKWKCFQFPLKSLRRQAKVFVEWLSLVCEHKMDIPPFQQRPNQQSQQQLASETGETSQDDYEFNLRKRKGQIIHCAKEHIEHGEFIWN